MLKLSSDGSDLFPKVLKLSSEVSKCKPLVHGMERRERTERRGVGRRDCPVQPGACGDCGRALHSFPIQLNLSSSIHRITRMSS